MTLRSGQRLVCPSSTILACAHSFWSMATSSIFEYGQDTRWHLFLTQPFLSGCESALLSSSATVCCGRWAAPVFGGTEGPRVCGCIICGGRGCVSVGLTALLLEPEHPAPQWSSHLGTHCPCTRVAPQDSGLQLSAGTLVLLSFSVFPGGRGNRSLLPSSSLVDPASAEHWG